MKTTNIKNSLIRSSIALAAMIAVWAPSSLWSAETAEAKKMKMQSAMMDQCEEMKKAKQQMRADMKAQDDKISAMVASMNNAAQEKKLELLASIVTHLVEQRTAMHAKNAEMEEKMIKHMMAHMETDRESLSKCPMMEKMDEKSK